MVRADAVLGPDRVRAGDVVVAMASSGLHSNGYSLARHVLLTRRGLSLDSTADLGEPLGEVLLTPTRIYALDCLVAAPRPSRCTRSPTSPAAGSRPTSPGCCRPGWHADDRPDDVDAGADLRPDRRARRRRARGDGADVQPRRRHGRRRPRRRGRAAVAHAARARRRRLGLRRRRRALSRRPASASLGSYVVRSARSARRRRPSASSVVVGSTSSACSLEYELPRSAASSSAAVEIGPAAGVLQLAGDLRLLGLGPAAPHWLDPLVRRPTRASSDVFD